MPAKNSGLVVGLGLALAAAALLALSAAMAPAKAVPLSMMPVAAKVLVVGEAYSAKALVGEAGPVSGESFAVKVQMPVVWK